MSVHTDRLKKTALIIIDILFAVYVITLLRITVFRSGFIGNIRQHGWFAGNMSFVPFVDYLNVLQSGGIARFIYLFFGNIVWFLPFGVLAAHRFRSTPTAVLTAIGAGFSLFIEFMQLALGTGVFELDDLILNTLGAFLGVVIFRAVKRGKAAKYCE